MKKDQCWTDVFVYTKNCKYLWALVLPFPERKRRKSQPISPYLYTVKITPYRESETIKFYDNEIILWFVFVYLIGHCGWFVPCRMSARSRRVENMTKSPFVMFSCFRPSLFSYRWRANTTRHKTATIYFGANVVWMQLAHTILYELSIIFIYFIYRMRRKEAYICICKLGFAGSTGFKSYRFDILCITLLFWVQ